ncbi:MAG: alpha-L-fucosidase [Frondihabitans sp.]|nr:alpha-L-fucosidase [Frondihabitans sp.]
MTSDWFTGAGLGVFVHWDHASQQGIEISWPLVGESIIPGHDRPEDEVTVAQYHSSAATFDPTAWDPVALAHLISASGARYVVFTARHHSGYAMYRTRFSDFSVEHSPFGRDITREFVDAARAEGLRIGIYYSLPDWHHVDYPTFTDADRPYAEEHQPQFDPAEPTLRHRRPSPEAWSRYVDYLRSQLTELLTEYGQIDLLWFDGEWERTAAEWHTTELRRLIKSLQPDVIINDRLTDASDYATPEQGLPTTPPEGPWELCLTMSEAWAYRPSDTEYKSPRTLVEMLIETTSRGGNLLLNVGPRGDGSIPEPEVDRLEEIGSWIASHGESVLGVAPDRATEFYGPVTRRPETVYLHLLATPVEAFTVRNVPVSRVRGVRLLGSDAPLAFTTDRNVHEFVADENARVGELRIEAPEPTGALIDVVAIDLTTE